MHHFFAQSDGFAPSSPTIECSNVGTTANEFLDYGIVSLGSLDGMDRVAGTFTLDFDAGSANEFIPFDYVFGSGIVAVPEPTSLVVLSMGAVGLAWRRRKRRA